ncbi:protein SLC31A2-like isoform X2 [Lineus longissimus]|uniref:protein SLC31A2-like isoform X2 n=1 Tax=Lineus longissimus TaxID=88925 RepID=UPI002B4EC4F9
MSHKINFQLEPIELLFKGWNVTSASDIAIAGVTAALLAVLLEASKMVMIKFLIISPSATFRLRVLYHASRTLFHMVQLVIGYLLMLMVMTFNFWIMLSVIAGTGAGYLSCAWTLLNVRQEIPQQVRVKSRTPNHDKQLNDFKKQAILLQLESSF